MTAVDGHKRTGRTGVCVGCGEPIEEVDLYGTPFFTHKPRRECLTWWHTGDRFPTHQARPA